MMRHKVVVKVGLHDHQNPRRAQREGVRELLSQDSTIECAPESSKAGLHIPGQQHGLDEPVQDGRGEQRSQGSKNQDRADEDQSSRCLDYDDEYRRQPDFVVGHWKHVEKGGGDPEQNRDTDPGRISRQPRVAENDRENRRIEKQRAAGQRAHRNMEQDYVQNSFPLSRFFTRKEIERAHPYAPGKHRHSGCDYEKRLLIQPILRTVHTADQKQR